MKTKTRSAINNLNRAIRVTEKLNKHNKKIRFLDDPNNEVYINPLHSTYIFWNVYAVAMPVIVFCLTFLFVPFVLLFIPGLLWFIFSKRRKLAFELENVSIATKYGTLEDVNYSVEKAKKKFKKYHGKYANNKENSQAK